MWFVAPLAQPVMRRNTPADFGSSSCSQISQVKRAMAQGFQSQFFTSHANTAKQAHIIKILDTVIARLSLLVEPSEH